MSLESRPFNDPTLLPIREAISSMSGSAATPTGELVPQVVNGPRHNGELCSEVAIDQNLIRLGVELEAAARAASGFMTMDSTVKFQAEVWRSEVWRDMVAHILRLYDSESQAVSVSPFRPQVLFDWGGLRVCLSIYGDTTQVQAWDRRYSDEAGMEDTENYLSMLVAADPVFYGETRLREFLEARQIRVLRLKSRTPLLTVPAALHILEQSNSSDSTGELVDLSKTDGELWVREPGVIQAQGGTSWRIAEDGTITRLPDQE